MLQKGDEVYILLCGTFKTVNPFELSTNSNGRLPRLVKGKILSKLTYYDYYGIYGLFLKCSSSRYTTKLPSSLNLINCKHKSPMRYTVHIYQLKYNLNIPCECISKNSNSLCKKYLFALKLYTKFVDPGRCVYAGREIIKTCFV